MPRAHFTRVAPGASASGRHCCASRRRIASRHERGNPPDSDMHGEGFLSNLRDKFKAGVHRAPKAIGGFPGEKHGPLVMPDGSIKSAAYMGPGTDIVARLKRGDQPLTETDKVSQAHDLRYALSATPEDVRAADKKFIRSLRDAEKAGRDNKKNTKTGRRIIQAKVGLEQLGVLKKGAFASPGKASGRYSADEIAMMREKLNELEQQGFGSLKPGDRAKLALLEADAANGAGVNLAGGAAQDGGFLPLLAMAAPLLMGAMGGQGVNLAGGGRMSKAQRGGVNPLLVAMALPIAAKLLGGGVNLAGQRGKGQAGGDLFGTVAEVGLPLLGAFLASKGAGQDGGRSKMRIDKHLMKNVIPRLARASGLKKSSFEKIRPLAHKLMNAAILANENEPSRKGALKAVGKTLSETLMPLLLSSSVAERAGVADMLGSGQVTATINAEKAVVKQLQKHFGDAVAASANPQAGSGFFDSFKNIASSLATTAAPILRDVAREAAPIARDIALAKLAAS